MSVSTVYDDVVGSVYEPEPEELEELKSGSGDDEESHQAGVVSDPYGVADAAAELPGVEQETAGDAEEAEGPASKGPLKETLADEPAAKAASQKRRGGKARGGKGGSDKRRRVSDEDPLGHKAALRNQIEYYFSDKNLAQDEFFHTKIAGHPEGWLDAEWLLGCSRVKTLGAKDDADIEEALKDSHLQTRRVSSAAAPEQDESLVGGKTESEQLPGETAAGGEAVATPAGSAIGTLQVRRQPSGELPVLRTAGWLAASIQRRHAIVEAGAGGESSAVSEQSLPAVGEVAILLAGEHAGKRVQVVARDGDDFTLLVDGADIVLASSAELRLAESAG